jgi:hypothetical protein
VDLAAFRESLRVLKLEGLSERERTLTLGFATLFDLHLQLVERLSLTEQRLHAAEAEVRRLKGLPDPPERSGSEAGGSAARRSADRSSEKERRRKKPGGGRGKSPRRAAPEPTETIIVALERSALPPDAVFKGYRTVRKQDLRIERRIVLFQMPRYYSPSERKVYSPELPAGWEGGFGPVVKALALALAHQHNVSQAGIHALLSQLGLGISEGTVAHLTTATPVVFETERQEVFQAGVEAGPWQQTDMTPTTVAGKPETCQVLGNPTFTHYHTSDGHDRAAVVRLLRGGSPAVYLLDRETLDYLAARGWPKAKLARLAAYCAPFLRSEVVLRRKVRLLLPDWSAEERHQFWTAALLAGYRYDPAVPRPSCLITDDASIYDGLFPEMGLCWIHELRHLKELQPPFPHYERELRRVRRQAWALYRALERYREQPQPEEAVRLTARFDRVFGQRVTYPALQAMLQRTLAKKERLLLVLRRPEIPLHNNDSELAVRKRVRRRDVSFGPRSRQGALAWDVYQSLAATTTKLGVNYFDYLLDRLTRTEQIPRLAVLIHARAKALGLGASWRQPTVS